MPIVCYDASAGQVVIIKRNNCLLMAYKTAGTFSIGS